MPTGSLDFTTAASEAQLASLAERLRERNFEVQVVDSASDALSAVLERIPAGSEVHSGKSKTLEDAGVFKSLMESGKYTFLRNQLFQMDRQTQMREIRKLGASPDFMVGSVQAVTEAGQLVAASASGSQLGPYASGAGQLILVIGSQKIVRDLETALGRIREYVQPYEDARLRAQLGIGTQLARILILERDFRPGRTTIILVREPIGV